jgi:hypothetical protein
MGGKQPRGKVALFRKTIASYAMKAVIAAMSKYWEAHPERGPPPGDLKTLAMDVVKEMDKRCWDDNMAENDYQLRMQAQIDYYMANIETIVRPQTTRVEPVVPAAPIHAEECAIMAARMIEAIDDLKQFREHTDFVGQDDFNLLQQLITFIENLPVGPNGLVAITQANQKDTVQLYYDRLFLPIQQTIVKQKASHAAVRVPPPQEPPMQVVAPTTPSPSSGMASRQQHVGKFPSPASGVAQVPASQPFQMPSGPPRPAPTTQNGPPPTRLPKGPRTASHPSQIQSQPLQPPVAPAPPPVQPSQQTKQTPEDFLRQLFTNVRTDCAVFYSTPHPPHF